MSTLNYSGRNVRGNKSCQTPRHLVFFDCETTAKKDKEKENRHNLSLRLGVAKDCRLELGETSRETTCHFRVASEFWDWIESRTSRHRLTLAFAHNAIFDLCTVRLTEYLDDQKWTTCVPWSPRSKDKKVAGELTDDALIALDCPPFILCVQNIKTQARVVFVDTLNYFAQSLEQLGEFINLPKLPICFESCDDEELTAYCERDVDIIKKSVLTLIKWQSDLDLGNFRYTLPANSFNAFRHRFMKHKIVIHDHVEAKKLERQSYYGGQTEAYRTDKIHEKVYLLDVSSLYPSVMIDGLFPVKLLDFQHSENGDLQCDTNVSLSAVASVLLRTPSLSFPVKRGGNTNYARGEFATQLSGPELSLAVEQTLVCSVDRLATYELQPLFRDFVQYFWGMRIRHEQNGEMVFAGLCKMILNSLSGKFGQLTYAWRTIEGVLDQEPWSRWVSQSETTGIIDQFRSIANRVQIKEERTDHPNSFCAISSFITAMGRERMRYLRGVAGHQNVYYQGVDSIVCNRHGFQLLSDASEIAHRTLGKLRLQQEGDYFHAHGKMDYTFDTKRVIAGVKQNAIRLSDDEFSQTMFSGPETLFRPKGERNITTDEVVFARKKS